MKVKNNLAIPVRVLKVNVYDQGILQPGQEIDVKVDPETVGITLEKVPTP